MREELALYYSSVRRADDCLVKYCKPYETVESGKTPWSFSFRSRNAFAFAKTQLYHTALGLP